MGLLTNANSGKGVLGLAMDKIISHSKILSYVCYAIGIACIFVMPWSEFSHKTYFSENALLPGLGKIFEIS